MSECIRTGADVYLVDYGAVVHCDLFELDNSYVIHYAGDFDYDCGLEVKDEDIDLIVDDIDLHLESAKVIIASIEECTQTKRLKKYLGDD